MTDETPFYLRYYSGHSGRFGHEFLEFDFKDNGIARYANNSNYRKDNLIRKEMCVSALLIEELKRIVELSEIMKEDDAKWPPKNKDGRQELEIRLGNQHISFEVGKIGSLADVQESEDPEGPSRLLLSHTRSESTMLLVNRTSFQVTPYFLGQILL